jgi:cobalamin biosynthesis protein CobW
VLQGVGDRFDYFYDRLWKPAELRQTRLVLIGRSLDQEQVKASLKSS